MTPLQDPTHIRVALSDIHIHELTEDILHKMCVCIPQKLGTEWIYESKRDGPLFSYSFVTRKTTFMDNMVGYRFQRNPINFSTPFPLVEPFVIIQMAGNE